MQFLNIEQHEKWLKEQFPKLQKKLYGFNEGEFISINTGLKSDYFPIIDTTSNRGNSPTFRAVIKLTQEEIPKTYIFTEEDREILLTIGVITYQVVIIQVNEEFNLLKKGHYPMNTLNV